MLWLRSNEVEDFALHVHSMKQVQKAGLIPPAIGSKGSFTQFLKVELPQNTLFNNIGSFDDVFVFQSYF